MGDSPLQKILFARLSKVDESRREVAGILAAEVPDKVGEVMDYASSRPLFEKWSQEIYEASDTRSLGNVRLMHQPVVVGKLNDIHYNDEAKAIEVVAKIGNDDVWRQVLEGELTGFSIGGRYAKRWDDGDLKRYTAEPVEASLVDNPCIPAAVFTMIRSDGSSEMRKAFGRELKQYWDCAFVHHRHLQKAEAAACYTDAEQDSPVPGDAMEKAARTDTVSPKEGESKYGDVTFADAENKKYPIDTEAHIRAAWNYINKPRNAAKYKDGGKAVKAKIVAAWKSKIDKEGPPSAKAEISEDLEKCLYGIAQLAYATMSVSGVADSERAEAATDGSDTTTADRLDSAVSMLHEILVQMAEEEAAEQAGDGEAMAMSVLSATLTKARAAFTTYPRIGALVPAAEIKQEVAEMADQAKGEVIKADPAEGDPITKRFESIEASIKETQASVKEMSESNEAAFKALAETLATMAGAKKPPVLRAVSKAEDTQPKAEDEKPEKDDLQSSMRKALANPIPWDEYRSGRR